MQMCALWPVRKQPQEVHNAVDQGWQGRSMTSPPSAEVLAEFGVAGQLQPLAGGQRTVWRVGHLVLKRLDGPPDTVAWEAKVLERVGPDAGLRVAPPVASLDGAWVVQGWTAAPFVAGRPAGNDWSTIIATGHALHLSIQGADRPKFLDDRDDVWACADRMVWNLACAPPRPELSAAFDARRPVDVPAQLVHGDLAGNVLVHDTLAPAVVDFSPYWRPTAWATAVVCADALLFAHEQPRLVLRAAETAQGTAPSSQMLLRAVLFRLVTDVLVGRSPGQDMHHTEVLDGVVRRATSHR
jgi:uncharacterized protein (TIGR02569 family)